MNILDKLQKQPEGVRKIILWIVVILVVLILAILWIYNSYQGIKKFEREKFIEELNLPSIEIPSINEQ